jgi:hypothetical protein
MLFCGIRDLFELQEKLKKKEKKKKCRKRNSL